VGVKGGGCEGGLWSPIDAQLMPVVWDLPHNQPTSTTHPGPTPWLTASLPTASTKARAVMV
jgi:hypothetical protein